jgi:hypothetical protein
MQKGVRKGGTEGSSYLENHSAYSFEAPLAEKGAGSRAVSCMHLTSHSGGALETTILAFIHCNYFCVGNPLARSEVFVIWYSSENLWKMHALLMLEGNESKRL